MALDVSTGTRAAVGPSQRKAPATGMGRVRGAWRRVARWGAGLAGISILTVLSGVFQTGYRTDFPPPTGKETYAQVMPSTIGGEPMAIQPLQIGASYRGARAQYGRGATIEIIQAATQADLDSYVQSSLRPRLQAYEQRASGKVDGRWGLRGQGTGGRIYGWQNEHWLFVIEAGSDALFDEAVDRFAFIEHK
jgi:hypothetical protein